MAGHPAHLPSDVSAPLHRREPRRERYLGLLLGTAIGDSVGLPYEGLSPRRARRLFKPPLRQRLVLGRGMASDDTEHACMTAQALLASAGEPNRFARCLAGRLRGRLVGVPAGIGLATLRAILKLWIGLPPHRSGVYSAGNGPAMRGPVIGVYAADDIDLMRALVRASTLLTHTDPAAEQGALAVALAAAYGAARHPSDVRAAELFELLRANLVSQELLSLLKSACDAAMKQADAATFAATLGLSRGVTG